jgi:hypothetical protein
MRLISVDSPSSQERERAGSDTMANYASLRGPVGLTRVYARMPKTATATSSWFDSLKHGRTFATNGPLLGFTLGVGLYSISFWLPQIVQALFGLGNVERQDLTVVVRERIRLTMHGAVFGLARIR